VAAEADPLETALRALRHRDRSVAELEARLEERGVEAPERRRALETLERIGYVDDERLARSRAARLAGRNAGDELIRHDLEGRGIDAAGIEAALAGLEPEFERAAAIVATRGRNDKTARYLASRGFGADIVDDVVAAGD
jgi:SOS response regulatory protein OraA/RecX